MNEGAPSGWRSGRSWGRRIFLWLLVIGIFVLIFRRIPAPEVLAAVGKANLVFLIPLLIFFTLLTMFFDAYVHQWTFNRFGLPISYRETLVLRGQTYFLLSLGFIYGQGGMAYFVSRRTGRPLSEAAGWIMFLTFSNLQALLIFPTLAVLFLADRLASPEFRQSPEFRYILYWLAISWPLVIGQMVFFARDWNIGLRRRLKQGAAAAFDQAGFKEYTWVMLMRGIQTVLWIAATYLGLSCFDLDISPAALAIRGPLVALIGVIPTPGRLGTTQGAWLLLFPEVNDQAGLVAFSLIWVMGISLLRWLIGVAFLAVGRAALHPGITD